MNEVDALRTHMRNLNHAIATTTCRKTVDVLRQMLRETEAKLRQQELLRALRDRQCADHREDVLA